MIQKQEYLQEAKKYAKISNFDKVKDSVNLTSRVSSVAKSSLDKYSLSKNELKVSLAIRKFRWQT